MTDRDEIVEIVGVTKRFPGVIALNRVSLGFRAGRSPRCRRRKRRRQVDADERAGGRISAGRGRDPDWWKVRSLLVAAGQPRRGHRRSVSGARPLPDNECRGKRYDVGTGDKARGLDGPPAADAKRDAHGVLCGSEWPKLDPDAKVAGLSVAEMQLVEIAAAVRQRARLLVLDEPNSAISKRESERLFDVVRQLRGEGVSIVYVSHRLSEVLDLADRISVMRDGRLIETLDNRNLTEDRLIRAMVGRDVSSAPRHPAKVLEDPKERWRCRSMT